MPYRLITIPEGFNLHIHGKKSLKSRLQHTSDGASKKVKIYTYILIPFKAIKISLFTSLRAGCCPLTAVTNGFSFLLQYNPNTFSILSGISHPIASHTIYVNKDTRILCFDFLIKFSQCSFKVSFIL